MAEPTQAEIDAYYSDLYQGKGGHISKADVAKVQKQILSQGLTSKWKGQGFGSAEANALDMAKSLVASGITDIHQLGQGTFYEPVFVQTQYVTTDGMAVQYLDGKYYMYVVNPNNSEEAIQKEVDPKTVTKQLGFASQEITGDGGEGGNQSIKDVFTPLTADQQKKIKLDANGYMTVSMPMGQGFINKDTGQHVLSNYNERTTGNAFGGTYAGKDNTAYRVQFDAKGNPYFYTTEHSSNDLLNILQSNPLLNIAANVAANYFLPGYGPALLAAAEGKDLGDVAKAYVLSDLGNAAGSYLSGSESLIDVLGQTGANIAANAAKSFITSGGKIDPVAALLAGGLDAGVGAIISDIPGFSGLDKGTQSAVIKAVSNTLQTGKLDPVSLAQAAFKAGTSAMANATNTPDESTVKAANDEFLKTISGYLSPETGKPLTGADLTTYASQNMNIDPAQWDSYVKNFQNTANNGGYTSQWQTVGTDRIMIQDDGSAIATNENGDPYSLTKDEVDQMVQNGVLNTASSGYVAATGGTGNNPGGSRNQTPPAPVAPKTGTPPPTGTPFAGTPSAAAPNAEPTVTRFGLDPLDVLRMKNDVAHINPLEELFGGSIYDHRPASSAQKETAPETDVVKALEDTQGGQVYSGGGDIHALLQLLRS